MAIVCKVHSCRVGQRQCEGLNGPQAGNTSIQAALHPYVLQQFIACCTQLLAQAEGNVRCAALHVQPALLNSGAA